MQKCYNVIIKGKVQDIGFRTLIEDIARVLELKGYAFNDTDGSVKMVCCGENGTIVEFLEMIRSKGAQKGVVIEDIDTEEIPFRIFLPEKFIRLYTDELADISRKLDIGIGVLKDIKKDTSALPDIKIGIDNLSSKFDSFIVEQREHNQWMKEHLVRMDEHNKRMEESINEQREHNKRLEKILEKLAEK